MLDFATLWTLVLKHLPQIFAGGIVAIYAWQRYGTPRSNRISTTRAQFYLTCCAYVACALLIYAVLTSLLDEPTTLQFLFFGMEIPKNAASLSAPYLSAVLLTTLLPAIPFLREIDGVLLRFFQRIGAIPFEVGRLQDELKRKAYLPRPDTQADVVQFLDADERWGELVAELDFSAGETPRHLLSRPLALTCEVLRLDRESPFLRDIPADAKELDHLLEIACGHADGFFRLQRAIPDKDENEPEKLQQLRDTAAMFLERAERALEKSSAAVCDKACLLLAQGFLSASWSDRKLKRRLQDRGFDTVDVEPAFVLNMAATVALMIFLIFTVGAVLLRELAQSQMPIARQVSLAFIISANYGIAAICAVTPKLHWSFAHRGPNEGHPVFAYLLSSLFAGIAAMIIGILHTSAWEGSLVAGVTRYFAVAYPWIIAPMAATIVLAFLCDNWMERKEEPSWGRWVEGFVVGLVLAAISYAAASWFRDLLSRLSAVDANVPPPSPALGLAATIMIGTAFAIGIVLGALVPHAYRRAIAQKLARVDNGANAAGLANSGAALRL